MVRCDYCGLTAQKVKGNKIYPHRRDLFSKTFFACFGCDAWVGCHVGSEKPMGRLANRSLRQWKMAAHAIFDPLWDSDHATMNRSRAYQWLADQMMIEKKRCHIGYFDVQQCKQVVEICKNRGINEELNGPDWLQGHDQEVQTETSEGIRNLAVDPTSGAEDNNS